MGEPTVAEALREAARRLEAVSDTARLDAELLMAEALGVTRSDLLLRRTGDPVPGGFEALVARREQHEPIAYILGRQEFYGLDLGVNPSVLIPRGDSEVIIEAARESFADRLPERVLDLGTGSGALLLAALSLWPEAEGLGVERDPQAIAVARQNAVRTGINAPLGPDEAAGESGRLPRKGAEAGVHALDGRARFVCCDWRKQGWHKHIGKFDLIVANPPYVEDHADLAPSVSDWEPAGALFAGADGLDDYRILIPQLPALLSPGGAAVFEIGASQADAVRELASSAGLASVLRRDLAGRPRALVLQLPLGKTGANS